MKINNEQLHINKISYNNRQVERINSNNSFADKFEKANCRNGMRSCDDYEKTQMSTSFCEIYNQSELKTEGIFPMDTEGYKIELANGLEGVQAYVITDKKQGRCLYIREDELSIQKDTNTGCEFVINMEQPFCELMVVNDELKGLLQNVASKRGFKLDETPLKGGLTVNNDIKTGLQYLTIKGQEWKGVCVLINSEEDRDTLDNLTNEYMKYPVTQQKMTANLCALLEIGGTLRRGKEGFVYITENGLTYIPYDGDPKKAWEIEMSENYFEGAREKLFSQFDFEEAGEWSKILDEANVKNGFFEVWDYYYNLNHSSNGCFKINSSTI